MQCRHLRARARARAGERASERASASCASHAAQGPSARDQACYYANKAIYISMRLSMCSLLERNCRGRLRLPVCAMTRMEPRAHSTPINMIRPEILIAFYLSPARLGIAQRRSKRRSGAETRASVSDAALELKPTCRRRRRRCCRRRRRLSGPRAPSSRTRMTSFHFV